MWQNLNIPKVIIINMEKRMIVPVLVAILLIPVVSATSDEGNTPISLYVNPCNVFLSEAACLGAGCNWCNGVCQASECVTGPEGKTPDDRFNISIIIHDPDKITSPGELDFTLFLENNNSYVVKGTIWTWFINKASGREYNRNNQSVFIEARSAQLLNITEFLFLVPGEYDLMVEHVRYPSRMKDLAQTTFTVKTATGFIPPETTLTPSEMGLVILFVILIIIVAFVILLLFTDYYKYVFSEPRTQG